MDGYDKLDYLYIDIETKSKGEPDFSQLKTMEEIRAEYPSLEELSENVPKTYQKDEAKSKAWVSKEHEKLNKKASDEYNKQIDEFDKAFRKKALNSLESEIVCIGLAYNDQEPVIIPYNEDESVMLKEMMQWIKDTIGHRMHVVVWVGQNVAKFDILRIWHRAVKFQIRELMDILPTEKWTKRVDDLNDRFNAYLYGMYTSLNDMCKFFGIKDKDDMDGSKVHDMFLAGKLDEIYDYCKNGDVRKTRMIHRMFLCEKQLESDLLNVK